MGAQNRACSEAGIPAPFYGQKDCGSESYSVNKRQRQDLNQDTHLPKSEDPGQGSG